MPDLATFSQKVARYSCASWSSGLTSAVGTPAPRLGFFATLFLRDEQLIDLLVAELVLAVVLVDDQCRAVGRDPHKVVAELEDFLEVGLALQHAEVGRALRLDNDGRHLGVEVLVDPGAAVFHDVAVGDAALGGLRQAT